MVVMRSSGKHTTEVYDKAKKELDHSLEVIEKELKSFDEKFKTCMRVYGTTYFIELNQKGRIDEIMARKKEIDKLLHGTRFMHVGMIKEAELLREELIKLNFPRTWESVKQA